MQLVGRNGASDDRDDTNPEEPGVHVGVRHDDGQSRHPIHYEAHLSFPI